MSKIVQTYCPVCNRITAHEIYTTNNYGERTGIERLFTALFTVGFSEIDGYRICECLSCGKKRPVSGG